MLSLKFIVIGCKQSNRDKELCTGRYTNIFLTN